MHGDNGAAVDTQCGVEQLQALVVAEGDQAAGRDA